MARSLGHHYMQDLQDLISDIDDFRTDLGS